MVKNNASDDAVITGLQKSKASPCTCAEYWVSNVKDGNWCYLAEGRKKTTCTMSNGYVANDWSWSRCAHGKTPGVQCYQPCTCAEYWVSNVKDGNWCYLAEGRNKTTCTMSNGDVANDQSWSRCAHGKTPGVQCYHAGYKNGVTRPQQPCSKTGSYPKRGDTDIGNTKSMSSVWYTPTQGDFAVQRASQMGKFYVNPFENIREKEVFHYKCILGDYFGPKWKRMCTYTYRWMDNEVGKQGSQPFSYVTAPFSALGFDWGCDPF